MAAHDQHSIETLEQGNIYFIYRPKVEQEEAEGLEDVQRLFLVLSPHGKSTYRLIAIGQKQLPDLDQKQSRRWGFVDSVKSSPKELEESLRQQTYSTKTRGERSLPAARPVGEGVYSLVQRDERTTFLAYALELPNSPDQAQSDFKIEPEASYVLSIKNPEKASPQGAGFNSSERKADFPKRLQEKFSDRRFIAASPPDFLDYEGAELILIGASDNVEDELGIELDAQQETESTAEIINDLRMRKSRHPIEPLLTGEWR